MHKLNKYSFPIRILSNTKHSLKIIKHEETQSPISYPPLFLTNGEFPYPPFTRYKWEVVGGDVSQVKIEEINQTPSMLVGEGGEYEIDVRFSFYSPGNYKLKVDRLKEGYDNITLETHEIEIDVTE